VQLGSKSSALFKCNNCDVEAPIEELRVKPERNNNMQFLHYHNKAERPPFFLDMLLCDRCKFLFKEWQRNHGCTGIRSSLIHNYVLLPLSNWFREQLVKQHAEAKSRLSLARWEIPLSAEHRQIIATA